MKQSPFNNLMQRLERVQVAIEKGTIDTKKANAITGAARTWLAGVNTALRVQKAAAPGVQKFLDGK